jgi:crotonobetainyl-CoA:carnitine CoA-transferase CaiB-like acyl-CoA transferase
MSIDRSHALDIDAGMERYAAETAPGPCAGLRVLDFSTMISGPFCTQALGDLGADVVKVEPPGGDPCRLSGAPFREPGFSGFLSQFNRNKRGLVLDLKQLAAQAIARRLAQGADVVLENFRPGVADRLGIGYDQLRAHNRGLVYVSISGFGSAGPYAELPAYDHVIQGLTGMMPMQGGDGPPRLVQGGVADKATAMTALSAVLAALLARERRGGLGQRVEVAMLDAYAAFALPEDMISRSFPPLTSNASRLNEVFRTWETADGHVVGLVIHDAQFQGLCRVLGCEDLASDPRFAEMGSRFMNFRELVPLLAPEMRKLSTAEFIERARKSNVPFAPSYGVDEFLADPQTLHNETVFVSEDPRFGAARYLRHPVRYEQTPASLRRHAPRLGEHSDEVLREAGLSEDEIAALRESGAVR